MILTSRKKLEASKAECKQFRDTVKGCVEEPIIEAETEAATKATILRLQKEIDGILRLGIKEDDPCIKERRDKLEEAKKQGWEQKSVDGQLC